MPKTESINIDVFGTSLCNLRSKLASAVAAQASIEGRRVLVTERDSNELRMALASNLIVNDSDQLELFTIEGVPSDNYLVALAPKWDQATEKNFATLAASFDIVICSHGTVLGGNGSDRSLSLLAGSFDGVSMEESIALASQLKSAPFIAAVPEPEPFNFAQNVAIAKDHHQELAESNAWQMPLYSHRLFTLPQTDELGMPLWQKISELIAALDLPPGISRAKPEANLLASSKPVYGTTSSIDLRPQLPDDTKITMVLDDPNSRDRTMLKQLRTYTSSMRSKLEARRQKSVSSLEQQAVESSATCNDRIRQANEQTVSQADEYATQDTKFAENYESNRSRNANLAKQLSTHLTALAEETEQNSQQKIATIKNELDAFITAEAKRKEEIKIKAQAEADQEKALSQATDQPSVAPQPQELKQPQLKAASQPQAQKQPEPKPEPKTASQPQEQEEPQPKAEQKAASQPQELKQSEPKPEPKASSQPQEQEEPEPKPEQKAEPQPIQEQQPATKLEPDEQAEAARIAREKSAATKQPEQFKAALQKKRQPATPKPAIPPAASKVDKPAAPKDDPEQVKATPSIEKKKVAPSTKLIGRTITRTSELKFKNYIDHAGVTDILEPKPLQDLFADAIKGKNLNPPSYDEKQTITDQFKQLHDFYFKKLTSKTRLAGGSYACALFALKLATRAHTEEGLGTQERVLREFANDAFDNARHQDKDFPLAHWFLNLCWMIEHKLHTGDHKHVMKLVQNFNDILFSAKPGINSKLHLQIMRALMAMLSVKLEEESAASTDQEADKEANEKIIHRLFADLPPSLESQLLYSKEKGTTEEQAEDENATAKVKEAVLEASKSWGDMIEPK